jgi:hypothetical protein
MQKCHCELWFLKLLNITKLSYMTIYCYFSNLFKSWIKFWKMFFAFGWVWTWTHDVWHSRQAFYQSTIVSNHIEDEIHFSKFNKYFRSALDYSMPVCFGGSLNRNQINHKFDHIIIQSLNSVFISLRLWLNFRINCFGLIYELIPTNFF